MRNDNRGFTLLELIIAISIFSIVIFMGYKVIDGTNKATNDQSNIFNEQQAANIVNKYLTKDLELCKNIRDLNDSELDKYRNDYTDFYGYQITDAQNNKVDYIVGIKDKYYDLLRSKDNILLPIIEKLKIKDNDIKPFTINIQKSNEENNKNRNLYTVNISNLDNKFEFRVNPRYASTPELDGGGGTSLNGEGHIIVHSTSIDKSVVINSSNDQGKYKQEIKVSKSNDGKVIKVSIKDYEFVIVLNSYVNGYVSGSINVNDIERKFENVDISSSVYNFEHTGLNIELRKEEYNNKDDGDDDDLIVQIKNGKSTLVRLEKDQDDNEIDVELYNDEIDIEIDDDGEVDIEIGYGDKSKLSTYDNDSEIDIDIAKKYIGNIYGIFLEAKQIEIDEVELNGNKKGNISYMEFNPSSSELDLEIETQNTDSSEMMVITRFTSKKEEKPIEQIYGDIKIERVGQNNKQQYLEITYPDKRVERVDIGEPKGQYNLNVEAVTNSIGKNTEIKLLPTNKCITLSTDKKVKQIEIKSKKSNQVKIIESNVVTKFDTITLNAGGGSTTNDEVIIKVKGN